VLQDQIQQIDRVVVEVFATMLEVACAAEPWAGPEPAANGDGNLRRYLNASVFFYGCIEGVCTVGLDPSAAAEIGAMLTGMSPADISPDLFADTAAGSWKTGQSQTGDGTRISCPLITRRPRKPAGLLCLTDAWT
jgi:hypothetical protein